MRILYLVKHSLPYTTAGYTIRTDNLVKKWSEEHQVYVLTIMKNNILNITTIHNNITYYHLNLKHMIGQIWKSKLNVILKKYKIKPDIIIATSNYEIGNFGYQIANYLNIPFHYDVRGFWELSEVSNGRREMDSEWFRNYVEKEIDICQKATKIYAITKQAKEELINRGINKNKIDILENFIHPENIKNLSIIEKPDIPNRFTIGYIGSLCFYEGLEDLVNTFMKIKGTMNLLIIGHANNSSQEYKKLVQQIKKDNRIILKINIQNNDVIGYYKVIDVVCIPRRNTLVNNLISPIKVYEAIVYNKKILTSDVKPLLDISNRYNYKTFKQNSVEDLKVQIEAMYREYEQFSHLHDHPNI